jgi:toluene monooxygenase system protein E
MSNDANTSIIQGWVDKWQPLADKAIDAYCAALTDLPDAAEDAKAYVISVRKSFGLA